MTTITLTYNERNKLAKKAMEYILSLGVFRTQEQIQQTRAAKKNVESHTRSSRWYQRDSL